ASAITSNTSIDSIVTGPPGGGPSERARSTAARAASSDEKKITDTPLSPCNARSHLPATKPSNCLDWGTTTSCSNFLASSSRLASTLTSVTTACMRPSSLSYFWANIEADYTTDHGRQMDRRRHP